MDQSREVEQRTRQLAAAGVTADMVLQQVTDEVFIEAFREAQANKEQEERKRGQEEQVKKMKKKADDGDLDAMFTLINWHRCGEMGLKKDEVQPWIDLAINRGCERRERTEKIAIVPKCAGELTFAPGVDPVLPEPEVDLVDSKLKEVYETIRSFSISKDDYNAKLNHELKFCEEQELAGNVTDKCRVLRTTVLLALRFENADLNSPPTNTQDICEKSSTAAILERFGALASSFEDDEAEDYQWLPQLEEDSEEDLSKLQVD